jgi:hypothetical protein
MSCYIDFFQANISQWLNIVHLQLRIKISDSHLDGGDLAVLGEHGGELLFGQLLSKVLDEDVREVFRFLAELLLALLAGNELADVDLKKIYRYYSESSLMLSQIMLSIG